MPENKMAKKTLQKSPEPQFQNSKSFKLKFLDAYTFNLNAVKKQLSQLLQHDNIVAIMTSQMKAPISAMKLAYDLEKAAG
jgi:hypothetical protein